MHICYLLGCAMQIYKACTLPPSNPERAWRHPQRHPWLMARGAYMPEARSWSYTPLCAAESKQDVAAVFTPGVVGER